MTLEQIQKEAYENAINHGWTGHVPVPEMIALIHSEASEALESFRNNEPTSFSAPGEDGRDKPMGIGSEFADIIIRIGHYAELLGLDLDYEVRRKLDYNVGRPFKHGGKKI